VFDDTMMSTYGRKNRARGQLQTTIPWAIGPDSVVWDDDGEISHELARQYVDLKIDQGKRLVESLEQLVEAMNDLGSTDATQRAPQVIGRLEQPDGTPAHRVQVTLEAAGASAAESRAATALTAADGSFVVALPVAARPTSVTIGLVVTTGTGIQRVPNVLKDLLPSGALAPIRLPDPAPPMPPSLVAALRDLVDGIPTSADDDEHGSRHDSGTAIAVGEDDCMLVFRKDTSSDRFPYGVMFRLTDPALSQPTLGFRLPSRLAKTDGAFTFYGPSSPESRLARKLSRMRFHLAERVPVDRPIDVEAFRDGLAVERPWGGVPVAGSLAIGYVVQMAQRWTPLGLALGDLVYSLPLAPGEQQRVAVTERSASSSVVESERLDNSEHMSFAERDDTSATATFASAFTEVAAGGSHYDTEASSFSVAAAVGGGGVFPFGCVAGGVATSFGTSSSSGNTNTWMNGARNSTSNAAQSTHSSVQRQAAARRSSSRTAMRLATAHETTEVVTKVITNHNKTRALTMQYWEVQRLFDVTTVAEGVNLVCLVPLDVIKFLPPGLPLRLSEAPDTREEVLDRYGRMLTHTDVLTRVVPARHRRGLALLSDFAANPTTDVAGANAPSTEIVNLTARGTFLATDEVFVTILGKRGMRVGPVRLDGTAPSTPPTGKDALASQEALFGALRRARQDSATAAEWKASISLPSSMPRQDITGFEITRRTQRLDYTFAPPLIADLGTARLVLGPLGTLGDTVLKAALDKPSVTRTYRADHVESEIGGPRVTSFSAGLPSPSSGGSAPAADVELVAGSFSGGVELPASSYPVAARGIPPVLSYSSVLEIEKTFQWVVRNTMTCSIAVFASLTPEERAVMLERYEIELPPDEDGTPRPGVPLLSCVTNNVLGWYGNSMVLPFIIPAAITEATGEWETRDDGTPVLVAPGITTGDIQDALTRFHTDGFSPPRSTIALPTKGVLGEAVLGHCPSAEKIDLTRFWNWQDSPGDEATQISPISMPTGSLTAGLTAPDALTTLTPQIQNFTMSPVAADTSLAAALVNAAKEQKSFDVGALTNAGNLTTLGGKTLDTAEAARKDALASATKLAEKAMETSAAIYGVKKDEKEKKDEEDKPDKPAGGETPEPTPKPGETPVPKPTPPQAASVHFALDQDDLTIAPAAAEVTALDALVTKAKEAGATGAVVRGYASPEGTPTHNIDLAHRRADTVMAHLATTGVTATRAEGGVLAGAPGDFPKLRRADIAFTY
jgi:outer membrane protein OmpA-like peptidoglycan-associated protein